MREGSPNKLSDLSWIFGYGSLMWNPGFPFLEQHPAELIGYHRSFCMYSQHHRGTQERPGLVLGLDEGGRCQGVAFRVAKSDWSSTITYLNKRELVGSYAYVPTVLKVNLAAEEVSAYTYVANPKHPNYAGKLPIGSAVNLILNAEGIGGRNHHYLVEVVRKLKALGHTDESLDTLLTRVEEAYKSS